MQNVMHGGRVNSEREQVALSFCSPLVPVKSESKQLILLVEKGLKVLQLTLRVEKRWVSIKLDAVAATTQRNDVARDEMAA